MSSSLQKYSHFSKFYYDVIRGGQHALWHVDLAFTVYKVNANTSAHSLTVGGWVYYVADPLAFSEGVVGDFVVLVVVGVRKRDEEFAS